MSMKRFWISWREPMPGDDYRPLSVPVQPDIAAWWCTGEAGDGSFATLCAVVDAESHNTAMFLINRYWTPIEWRFSEVKPPDWRPPQDRFPWPEEIPALEGE